MNPLPHLSDPAAVDYGPDPAPSPPAPVSPPSPWCKPTCDEFAQQWRDGGGWSAPLAAEPGPIPAPPLAARLQSMRLPNGRFLLVLDGAVVPGWTDAFGAELRDKIGAAAVVAFSGTVDVVDDDQVPLLAALDDEVADEDRAIVDRIRREYAAERAELEGWRHEREELRADLEMANGDAARLLDEVAAWRSAM